MSGISLEAMKKNAEEIETIEKWSDEIRDEELRARSEESRISFSLACLEEKLIGEQELSAADAYFRGIAKIRLNELERKIQLCEAEEAILLSRSMVLAGKTS